MTAGQPLVEVGVFPPVQLVDGQLPDGERPRGAVASVAVTLVRHPNGGGEKKISGHNHIAWDTTGR